MNNKSKYSGVFKMSHEAATCKICAVTLTFSQNSGTNVIRRHLSKNHKSELDKIEQEEKNQKKRKIETLKDANCQSVIPFKKIGIVSTSIQNPRATSQNPIELMSSWEPNGEKTIKIEKAIMKMIVLDARPLRTVEQEGFVNLMSVALPKFRLKSRNHFASKCLPDLRSEIEEKIKQELSGVTHYSLTTDAWTSKDGKQSLLALTVHFVNLDYEPKVFVLGSCAIKARHTAVNLQKLVDQALMKFELSPHNMFLLVRDGARSMECLGNLMKVPSIHCFAHNLQLCVNDCLEKVEEIGPVAQKMRQIVKKMHKSNVCRDALKESQLLVDLPQKNLAKDVVTRWSSLINMGKSFIENQKAVRHLMIDYPECNLPSISNEEWKLIEVLVSTLQPIAETTSVIQDRFLATASLIIPSTQVILFKYDEISETSKCGISRRLATAMAESIRSRCSKYLSNKDLKTATFVDPRYRNKFFETSHVNDITEILKAEEDSESPELLSQTDSTEVRVEKLSIFDRFIREKSTEPECEPEKDADSVENEIILYLKGTADISVNPFRFWKNDRKFPRIRKLAMKFLSAPSTSSESERIFSMSGLITVPKRMRMSPDTLDSLTFCAQNLKIFGVEKC